VTAKVYPFERWSGSAQVEVGPVTWDQAIADWLVWLRAAGARPATLRLRRYQMLRVAAEVRGRPWTVAAPSLARWLAGPAWKPETRRSHLAALRSFYAWGRSQGLTGADPTGALPRMRPTPGEPRPASEDALGRALAAGDDRQRLMVDLAARHGLRRGEIARIHARDIVDSAGGWSLVVHGKGGKDRTVPLLDGTAAVARARAGDGWLFPGPNGHLTAGHVGVLIGRVLPPGVTPHQLRHRFATVVYRRTLDIRNLQRLLGHASVATTQRYAAPDDAQLRAVLSSAA